VCGRDILLVYPAVLFCGGDLVGALGSVMGAKIDILSVGRTRGPPHPPGIC